MFRVDASPIIGSGHVMRCLALAAALEPDANVYFVCRSPESWVTQRVQRNGFDYIELPADASAITADRTDHRTWLGVSQKSDALSTRKALIDAQIAPDWIVVDHYGIGAAWESELRRLGAKIMVIDDLADREHDCDLLLDQTLGRSETDYQQLVPSGCRTLTGSQYALLRPQFARLRYRAYQRRRSYEEMRRVIVSFGRNAPPGILGDVIHGIRQCAHDLRADVVLGGAQTDCVKFRRALDASDNRIRLHGHVDAIEELMLDADLAVGAAGTTSWERCALGLPSIVVATAENQSRVLQALVACGAAVGLNGDQCRDSVGLSKSICEIARSRERWCGMARSAFAACDGLGTGRVLAHLFPERLQDGRAVSLRAAASDDMGVIFAWQNHSSTRKYARSPEVPSWAEHEAWVRGKIEDPNCVLSVIEVHGSPAGVLRLDRQSDKQFEVSILIDPKQYRSGIGRRALRLASRLTPWAELRAYVLPQNEASKALFRAVGFSAKGEYFVKEAHCQ